MHLRIIIIIFPTGYCQVECLPECAVCQPSLENDIITKTYLFKYIEISTSKNWQFSDKKNPDIFHISAQNIDCGYSLEPPRRGGSNEYHNPWFWAEIRKIMYTPVNPSFTILKWGLRGSKLYRYVFVMTTQVNGPRSLSYMCFNVILNTS